MKYFELLLLFSLAVFPLGQLATLSLGFLGLSEVRVHLLDLLVFFLVSFWLGRKVLRKEKLPQTSLNAPLFLFLALALISLLVNTPFRVNLQGEPLLKDREVLVSFLYFLRLSFYVSLFWSVFDFVKKNPKKKNLVLESLILVGTASGVFGLLQYFFMPDVRPIEYGQWDPHYYRAVGTFLDPTFLGIILVLTLILVFFKLEEKRKNWLFFAGGITFLGLALTYSRASYLSFLLAAGVISYFRKKPKLFLAAFLLLAATILFLPRPGGEGVKLERESTVKARILNWQESLKIARDQPLFGVGFNSYRYAQRRYGFLKEGNWQVSHAGAGADSSLLFVFATTGIFGFMAYLWLWISLLKGSHPVFVVSGLALLAHSFFANSLFYPFILFWLWVLRGSLEERSGNFQKKQGKVS